MRSGSLFGSCIEPDVSIRKTRLACGRSAGTISKPLMPMVTSLVALFHGVGMTVTFAAKGVSAEVGPG